MNARAVFPSWPGDAELAVALTFDVDGEAPWLGEGPENSRRLTLLSQGRFGPARGLERILDLLAELAIRATFYVPGHTADHHPEAVAAILAAGHEVGHHGYLHRSSQALDVSGQRADLEEGLTALDRHGVRPLGYRSPGWELTPQTLGMLAELGFSYDSSLMADDRPYWETSGTVPLLELPGHWSLCDWPYFGWTPYHGGLLADPAAVERIWLEEFESARQEHRMVTYTMHPEAIGRGYLLRDAAAGDHRHAGWRPPVVRVSRRDRRAGRTRNVMTPGTLPRSALSSSGCGRRPGRGAERRSRSISRRHKILPRTSVQPS